MRQKKYPFAVIGATILFVAMAVGIYIGEQSHEAVLRHPSESVTGVAGPAEDDNHSSAKINLNTATEQELMELPNIGEKRAKAIVQYREDIGGFQSLYQLEGVSGIGEKILEQILPYLTIE